MTMFSSLSKNKQSNSRSASFSKRPKLYVLASKPARPDQPQTAEWSLELSLPAPLTQTAGSDNHKHSFFSHSKKPSADSTSSTPSTTGSPSPDQYYYFSRLNSYTHTANVPGPTVLKIFLCSVTDTYASTSLPDQIAEALSVVHFTSDSPSYLRQSLFALQTAELIPGIPHGLNIDKFMTFAMTYLADHLESLTSSDNDLQTVNYSKIVKENERLRAIISSTASNTTDVPPSTTTANTDDEDHWNLPIRSGSGNEAHHKSWGGFWVTHGPGANLRSSSRDRKEKRAPWERRDDVYGGLM